MKPIIFTLSTHEHHPGLQRFQRSCADHGWEMDLRVPERLDEFEMWRMFWAALPEYRTKGYTHALRLDAWDTITMGKPAELEVAFAHYGNPALLISAEVAPWPGDYRKNEYPPTDSPWKYAHSPVSVDLSKHLEPSIFVNTHGDYGADQRHFADLILSKVPGIAHDTRCLVVQALGHACNPWTENFALVDGRRIQNLHTKSYPIFSHGNGRTDDTWIMPL